MAQHFTAAEWQDINNFLDQGDNVAAIRHAVYFMA